jgi:hypothetical protein
MPKIKLSLSSLSLQEKIAKAREIVAALTGNSRFPSPVPPLPAITTAANEADTAFVDCQEARRVSVLTTRTQNRKEDALDKLLNQIAGYVDGVADGDEEMIRSAGIDMRAPAVPVTDPPGQPQGLAPTAGDHDGEIDLSWDTVTGAKSYVIEISNDPVTSTSWSHTGVSTRSSFTAQGLHSGTRYWFRVAAVNNNGQSGWSDPATKIAP